MLRRRTAALAVAFGVAACGPDRGPRQWLDDRSAIVHCTSAGRDLMPPVLRGLPVAYPNTGLYARQMDPSALGDLGFARDTVACAMLQVPTTEEIERTEAAVAQLAAVHQQASVVAASAATRCTCEVAQSMGMRGLVFACARREAQSNCDVERLQPAVRNALGPVADALAVTPPPVVHWRLAGKTDRPGWFADHESDIVPRHSGGSTFYVRGQAVPARDNYELINALLGEPGVTVVVRQDGGLGLLVVRELGKELILDHFSYAAVDADHLPLLSSLDNAHIEDYVARLAKPSARRELAFGPEDGNLVEVDAPLVQRLDAVVLAAAPLAGGYALAEERWSEPDVLVDRVAIQAPFGKQGQVLRARFTLSSTGTAWANTLPNDLLTPTLDELGLAEVAPEFTPPARSGGMEFFARGSVTHRDLIHGLHRVPNLMREVEMSHPSTVQGKASAWEFALPTDDLVRFVGEGASATGLRDAFAQRPYVVQMSLDAPRGQLSLEFRPR